MAYGTPPVARSTGGLADTISQYDEKTGAGDGFLFSDATTSALYNTLGWACSTYYDRPGDLARMRFSGMSRDFSWKRSAAEYSDLYGWAVAARSPQK